MREQFNEQLERLHVELIKMGSLCEEAISIAVQTLRGGDPQLEQRIKLLEREIDQKESEIEAVCMRLLLQQQPVAGDLRNISSALKMISDMERIGDQAADIAELSPFISGSGRQNALHLEEMAKTVVRMVTDSVEAFVQKDLSLARSVMRRDDEVDALFDRVKAEITQLIQGGNIEASLPLDLLMAAKYFERIGDHAVNIAEWVEYSITGVHKRDAV